MKHTQKSMRKSSALLAAGAGAAVCITGGGAQAAFVMGSISVSNGGTTSFAIDDFLHAQSGNWSWHLVDWGGPIGFSTGNFARINGTNTFSAYAVQHSAGVTVNSAMPFGFEDRMKVAGNISDKYFAVRSGDFMMGGPYYYGWLHVVSSNGTGTTIQIDQWGYESSQDTPCKTLADSVKAQKLGLADGREKLVWSNANEDGVARYEVQAKDASGAWNAVSSEAPGAGMYSSAVPKGSECRVVVEKVDGTTENIAF